MPSFAILISYLRQATNRWYSDQSGATAVEYGLILALISLAIVASVTGLGSSISGVAQYLVTTLGGMIG